jgi:sugar O-acyltransferase (sialic acid O-acetyltransferase NeuD family)
MATLHLCGAGNPEGVRLALAANRDRRWDRIVLLDDDPARFGESKLGVPVIGPISLLRDADSRRDAAVNLVARTTAGRRTVRERIRATGVPFAPLIAPDVDIEGASVASDVLVYQHATIGPESEVADGCVVFMGAVVGHEAHVRQGCVIASNAVINARVEIGEGTYVGSCATILPEVRIGPWATIGAGSLVVSDVPGGASVVGVPAETIACTHLDGDEAQDQPPAPAASLLTPMELERLVVDSWCGVLGLASVDRDANFFDVGGCSLHALQVRERLRQAAGLRIAVTDVFRFPTVQSLARHLARESLPAFSANARAEARRAARLRALGHY